MSKLLLYLTVGFEGNYDFMSCYIRSNKIEGRLYFSQLKDGLYFFLSLSFEENPSTYQAQKKANNAYVNSILGDIDIEQIFKAASENNLIPKING